MAFDFISKITGGRLVIYAGLILLGLVVIALIVAF
jgi:hypothetical protein